MHHMSHTAELVGGICALLLIAAATLAATNRIRLPFTVALLLVGMALAWLAEAWPANFGMLQGLEISSDLILYVFLPALVFESAFHLDVRQLRQDIVPVLGLAIPGLLLSTFIIGGLVGWVTDIPFEVALLLGAILSATDPVAVIALFKRLGAPKRLTILVEGESLFNDATSIVLARLLVGIVAAGAFTGSTLVSGIVEFFTVFFGGLLVGWAMGLATGFVLGKVRSDSAIEITLTTILAYLSFLVAEEVLHVSGVMATVAAGLTFGGRGWMRVSPDIRSYVEHFWEYVGFVATSLIFLMVGLKVELSGLIENAWVILCTIFAMLLSRIPVVFGLLGLLEKIPGAQPVDNRFKGIMYWGGLRGAIALAIVLSLPEFEYTETFIAVVMGAVLFTLLVQGVTVEPLMKRLGLDKPPLADRFAQVEGALGAKLHANERIPELSEGGLFSGSIAGRLQAECQTQITEIRKSLAGLRADELNPDEERRLLLSKCFAEERAQLISLFNKGHLREAVFRQLLHYLALQLDIVRYGGELKSLRFEKLSIHSWQQKVFQMLGSLPVIEHLVENQRLSRVAMDYQINWAHFETCDAVLNHFEELRVLDAISIDVAKGVRVLFEEWRDTARQRLDEAAELYPEFVTAMQEQLGRRLELLAEAEFIESQARRGTLPANVAESMKAAIDSELRELSHLQVEKLRIEPTELLRKVPFFTDMPEHEFDALAQRMHAHTYSAGENIIQQDDPGDSLFLIARGVVRVIRNSNRQEIELASLMVGDFFGEMALLHREPRSATVRAVTPCTVYELRRSELDETMRQFPQIRQALEAADAQRKEGIRAGDLAATLTGGKPQGDE